jgi:hypothetical protein
MTHGRLVLGLTLVAALAVTGCAGKVRVASGTRCQAHGGTYNATAKTCTYTASTQSVQQTCQAEGRILRRRVGLLRNRELTSALIGDPRL